jgi:hypothetical protein
MWLTVASNEGKQYEASTSLHFKESNAHVPHATKNGCKLLVLWTERPLKEAADNFAGSIKRSDRHLICIENARPCINFQTTERGRQPSLTRVSGSARMYTVA